MTRNPDFKSTPLFDVEFSETIQDRQWLLQTTNNKPLKVMCRLINCVITYDLVRPLKSFQLHVFSENKCSLLFRSLVESSDDDIADDL